MRDKAVPGFLSARKDAVAKPQRAFAAALNDAKLRQRNALRLPLLWHRNQRVAVHFNDFQDGHLWYSAHFVECAARGQVNQPLVGHIAQQRFQRDFLTAFQPESTRNFSLSRWFPRVFDKLQNLFAGRQAGLMLKRLFGQINMSVR